jgi:hypothetical protein
MERIPPNIPANSSILAGTQKKDNGLNKQLCLKKTQPLYGNFIKRTNEKASHRAQKFWVSYSAKHFRGIPFKRQ